MKVKEYIEPLTDLNSPTNEELRDLYNDLVEKVNIILDEMYYSDSISKKWGD